MKKLDIMVRILLSLILANCGIQATQAQKVKDDQEQASLEVSFFSSSYHHLRDYQQAEPHIQMEEKIWWNKLSIGASTSHLLAQANILRAASFAVKYRTTRPYQRNWIESGLTFTYDKQDPLNTESSRLAGWDLISKMHREENEWYVHELEGSLGYYYGEIRDPEIPFSPKYVLPEIPTTAVNFLKTSIAYKGTIRFPLLWLNTSIRYDRSIHKEDLWLSPSIERSVRLSPGQELHLYGGVTWIGVFRSKTYRQYTHAEVPSSLLQATSPDLHRTGNNHYFFLGIKMKFLRGKKMRAF